MKRINTMELYELVKNMDEKLDRIEQKIDALNGVAVKTEVPKRGKSKAAKKNDYEVVATRQENVQKVYEAMGYVKGMDFDRKLYETTAKRLGVWSDKMHRVVGTYK